MFSEKLKISIEAAISNFSEQEEKFISVKAVGGGCINETFQVKSSTSYYFLKLNRSSLYPGMFKAETIGLKLLRNKSNFKVPVVVGIEESGGFSFLILEYIEQGLKNPGSWALAGEFLADLHRKSAAEFGLDHDNFIGSLPQSNKKHQSWCDFFIYERLQPQLIMAVNGGYIDKLTERKFQDLYKNMGEIFPSEPPALLHGDLWSGNYFVTSDGIPSIFDPAVYYGHREMDIAMTKLFGGFDRIFYEAYNQTYPFISGWEKRIEICNLYPLLVHLNLFGRSYMRQIKEIISSY